MKHSIFVKFLVILLASLSILTAVACSAGIYAMESADLYANGIHSLQDQQYDILARSIAKSYATWYAVESEGNLSYSMMQSLYTDPEMSANFRLSSSSRTKDFTTRIPWRFSCTTLFSLS